ncbi:MAG: gluconolaconase [Verrucomicrobia bacterium]|nr:gluconolaconase [Verrucomicrobiota bacterium]
MKRIQRILIFLLTLAPLVAAAEPKVLEVGEKPESVCRGFNGKLYVTIIGGEEPGDGGINVIEGDKVSEFCRGMNSPKGMAFVGGYLITADETIVWKVDSKGAISKLAEVDDFPNPVEFLNDVAASADGKGVYVTEMSHPKWMFNPQGERQLWPLDSPEAKPPMTGCVYKVGLDGAISLAVPAGDKRMPGPNGVTTSEIDGREILVMGDFFTGRIVSYDGEKFEILASGMRGADAVSVTADAIFVSSWTVGKVWRYDRKSAELKLLSEKFTTAADFFHDVGNKQLVVPDLMEGTVTFLPLD